MSKKLNFILYADDTTLTSPLCSFTHGAENDVCNVSSRINSDLLKISDWLTVNKLSLNVEKTKFMIFHNYQRVIANEDIPDLKINDKHIKRVSCFNFLGLTINEFMNWSTHSSKIANKISRTLGIMNRLKRYLPFSAMKLMYDSLILSHLQFGITCWGFEWNRIFKLQKRALRIMTNSKYNAYTEPLFKELEMLKVSDIFDIHLCLNILARYLHSITIYTKLKRVVRTKPTCFLPELSMHIMFWGTVSQNCCRNILGLLPKGPKPTVLNRLSLCLRHLFLDLTPM